LRINGPVGTNCGDFRLGAVVFRVSDGAGWDHVSVSARGRLPTWEEMDRVKRRVFGDDEVVMQLHINDGRKVDLCQTCLHLWRPQTAEELAATRQRWEASGEVWPYGSMASVGAIPLPARELV